jgi:hypothetical protein
MANPITALADVRRRLAKLKPERPWVDSSPWAIPHLLAVIEGRPFSYIRREPSAPLTEEQEDARRRVLAEADRVAARLEQDDPGGAARFQADRERRLAATMKALEREAAAREGA